MTNGCVSHTSGVSCSKKPSKFISRVLIWHTVVVQSECDLPQDDGRDVCTAGKATNRRVKDKRNAFYNVIHTTSSTTHYFGNKFRAVISRCNSFRELSSTGTQRKPYGCNFIYPLNARLEQVIVPHHLYFLAHHFTCDM